MSNALSAHGTLIKRNGTTIGELRDITGPALMRNPIDVSPHNSPDEHFVVGFRRKGEVQFNIGFLPQDDTTHGFTSGLIKAYVDGSKDLYEVDWADGGVWYFSGFVTNVGPSAPVDGGFEAAVTIRPTGGMIFT